VEYQRQVNAKKVPVSYFNKNNKEVCNGAASDKVATMGAAIERAFPCLKGKHA
jgi:hypothetical protein